MTARLANSTSSSAARNGATARGHRRRVERAGDVEPSARSPRSRAVAVGARRAPSRGTREHDLAGRVVVGDGDAVALGELGAPARASPPSSASIVPSPLRRRTRPSAGRAATTSSSASSRVERAGGGERRELAERVAGEGDRRRRGRERVQPARLAQKIAGCAKRVDSSTRAKRILADQLGSELEQVGRGARDVRRACPATGCPARGTGRRCVRSMTHTSRPSRHAGASACDPPIGG